MSSKIGDGRQPSVTAVVVHFGSVASTERTLRSLESHAPGIRVLVVDNDGTFAGAMSSRPSDDSPVVLSPGRNLGYGAACNLAARNTTGDFLLFLNNDVELQPGTVERLSEILLAEPSVAVVAPGLIDSDRRPMTSIRRAPTPRRILFENLFLPRLLPGIPFFHGHHTVRTSHRRARDVESLEGAILLIRRTAFEEVGGFDEQYFFFVEETDLFERLRSRRWRIRFDPVRAAIHHGGVASRGIDREVLDRWLHQGFRAYARKFHGSKGERATVIALSVGANLRWLLSFAQFGPARRLRRARYAKLRRLYKEGSEEGPARATKARAPKSGS